MRTINRSWCQAAAGLLLAAWGGCADTPGDSTNRSGCGEPSLRCAFEIAFDSARDGSTEIYALDLESGAVRKITDSVDPGISNRFPDWSPDGRHLVFVSENESGLGDLFVINADGSELRRLTSDPARYENPAWAPGGSWIAFEKGHDENWGLFLVRPDGSDLHQLEGENLFHPSWSPDGKRLAVVTGDDDEWFGAILSLEGGDLQRITPEGLIVGSVKWSPKGSRVAFDAVIGTNFDLWVVDESGSNAHRLTTSPAIDARPEWSLDDSSLVFHSTRDFGSVHEDGRWKQFELYVLKLDGGTIERLTTNEVFDAHPDWCLARAEKVP